MQRCGHRQVVAGTAADQQVEKLCQRLSLALVIGDALLIGVTASAIGLAAGLGFAKPLNALFDAVGFGIPRTGLVLEILE